MLMELGQITLVDIMLTLLSIIGGGWLLWVFVKRKTNTKNVLKGNTSGGSIAGGSIINNNASSETGGGAEISKHQNILKNNTAAGDIAGGDIKK